MKRIYEMPKVEVTVLDESDIVTVSNLFTNDYSNDNEQNYFEGWWK